MNSRIRLGLVGLFCLLCLSLSAKKVYTISSVPNDRLKNATDCVSNPDGVISQFAEEKINAAIADIERFSTAEIAVVLLQAISNDDMDDFATRLFTHWGIGKQNDNGLLFLLVHDRQEMVFRTGYGLEGVLPDVVLSRIIRNDISPLLRQGDFDGGLVAGMSKVCDYLKNPETVQEIIQQEQKQKAKDKTPIYIYLVISLLVAAGFFYFLYSKSKSELTNYQKYLSLNKQKGVVIFFAIVFPFLMLLYAFVYFVALKRLRSNPIACRRCGYKMQRLIAPADKIYLTVAQQTEKSIGSVDYDVWLCNQCKNTETLAYNRMSNYSVCPYCKAKTYYLAQNRIVKQATSFSTGQGEKIHSCKNCNKTHSQLYTIPMIIAASGGSRGRGGSGGGSFGGSWGGGRTGGGGARGGW